MLGINDHAAAMCECGDYITYYSNMEVAIFFFQFYERSRLKSRMCHSAVPKGAPVFQFMCCRRQETNKTLP